MQENENECLCNFFSSDILPIPQMPTYFLSTQSETAETCCEWIDYGNQEFIISSINNEIINSHFYKRTLLTSKELNIQMSNAFTFSFQEQNAYSLRQSEQLNNTCNSNEYLITVNFNDDREDSDDIVKSFVEDLFKREGSCVGGEPCEVYSDLIKESGIVEKRYEEVMNFKCRMMQHEIEIRDTMINEMQKEIDKYREENRNIMEENKKLFEIIDVLQQIKEKEITNNIDNDKENSLRSSNESIPILIENKRINCNNNLDKVNIKSNTITTEHHNSISVKTIKSFNKQLPNKNCKSSTISPSYFSPTQSQINIHNNSINSKHNIKINTPKYLYNKEQNYSKRNYLTNEYSNSYLFSGTKCYITINQPSTKNSTRKRFIRPPIPTFANSKLSNKVNMKTMNSSPSQRKVIFNQETNLYKDEEKTNSLEDIEKRLSIFVSDANASGYFINNSNGFCKYNNINDNKVIEERLMLVNRINQQLENENHYNMELKQKLQGALNEKRK